MTKGILLAVIIAVFLVGVFILNKMALQTMRSTWIKVGKKLGLQLGKENFFGMPSLFGTLDGLQVSAEPVVSSDNKHIYTTVSIHIDEPLPFNMLIRHEGLAQKVGKLMGGEDLQVGDEELDRHFIFAGNDPRAMRELVTTPAVKNALLIARKHCNSLRVDNQGVHLREEDQQSNPDRLTHYIRSSVALAKAIGQAAPPPPAQLAKPAEFALPAHPEARAAQGAPAEQDEQSASSSSDSKNSW